MTADFSTDTIKLGEIIVWLVPKKRTTSQKIVDVLIAYEKRWDTTKRNLHSQPNESWTKQDIIPSARIAKSGTGKLFIHGSKLLYLIEPNSEL